MGGGVAVTARRANGEVVRMCRWTNPLPFFFQNMRFVGGDESHLDEYLGQWHDFVGGARRGEEIDREMAAHDKLAPFWYGLVVIDYQTRKVLSLQGYSALISVSNLDFLEDCLYAGQQEWPRPELLGLIEHGRVNFLPDGRHTPPDDWRNVTTWEEGRAIARSEQMPWFQVDTSPWEFLRFPETREGVEAFRKHLVDEMGFRLTAEEEDLWSAYARRWEEDDEC